MTISQSGRSPDIVAMQRAAPRGGGFHARAGQRPEFARRSRRGGAARAACGRRALGGGDQDDDRLAGRRRSRSSRIGARTRTCAPRSPTCRASSTAARPRRPKAGGHARRGALALCARAWRDAVAVAAEAALKLKETCAIHAEAFSSAEVLHGPAGVIGQTFPSSASRRPTPRAPAFSRRSIAWNSSARRRCWSTSRLIRSGRRLSRRTAAIR